MNRFVMADPQWCTGCKTCLAACSDVHKKQGLQQHPRLALVCTPEQTAPVQCHHCEDAPCQQVCPVTPLTKNAESPWKRLSDQMMKLLDDIAHEPAIYLLARKITGSGIR